VAVGGAADGCLMRLCHVITRAGAAGGARAACRRPLPQRALRRRPACPRRGLSQAREGVLARLRGGGGGIGGRNLCGGRDESAGKGPRMVCSSQTNGV
jgi:hypothetical protein